MEPYVLPLVVFDKSQDPIYNYLGNSPIAPVQNDVAIPLISTHLDLSFEQTAVRISIFWASLL